MTLTCESCRQPESVVGFVKRRWRRRAPERSRALTCIHCHADAVNAYRASRGMLTTKLPLADPRPAKVVSTRSSCQACGSVVYQVESSTGLVDLRKRLDGALTCYEHRGQPDAKVDPRLLGPQYAWKADWL